MPLIDIYSAAEDVTLQSRCLAATWKAAQDIMVEDPNEPNHQARKDWATNVLRDSTNITPRQLVMQVLRNPTIAEDPLAAPDGDLQFQINSIIASLVEIG